MSRMFCTPSASSTVPISKILPSGSRGQRSVVFLRGQAPVSRRDCDCPNRAPQPVQSLAPPALGIPCRRDCGLGVIHCAQVGQHQTIHAAVQRLLDHALVALAGVRRNCLIRRLDDRPGITGGPWQMRPLSRGHVLVRTPDPHDQPAINPRYLAEDTDQRAIVGGLKFLRRLFAAPALAKHIIEENLPGPIVQSDDELLDYARSTGSTVYHASCSCMMGNHGMAVVDDQLRVHGLEALRVVDASVMPAVSSTNTNAPTIMIAEKGATMIKSSAREKLAA